MQKTTLQELINLNGKVAIVTGGAMGIGEGIVRRLHEAGANVVIADMNKEVAETLANELNSKRENSVVASECNVSVADQVNSVVDLAVGQFGGVDILVNNAGIYPFAPLSQLDEAAFRKVLDINLVGPYLFIKRVSEQMITQGRGGKIVNVASIDALHPSMVGLAAYDASKHGLWGFTKNVALELATHNIAVNALAPGGVATPGVRQMMGGSDDIKSDCPMGRLGDSDEMGRIVLFLASDLSSYMTGSIVVADGGQLLK